MRYYYKKFTLKKNERTNRLKLIPHGEKAVNYYSKSIEYFKNHVEKVKRGFINLPLSELGIHDADNQSFGYEFK